MDKKTIGDWIIYYEVQRLHKEGLSYRTIAQTLVMNRRTVCEIDMEQLSTEFSQLREYMAKQSTDAEHSVATGAIANAEMAARQKDSSKVTDYLKSAGKWAFEMATKIGVSSATEAIKKSSGF